MEGSAAELDKSSTVSRERHSGLVGFFAHPAVLIVLTAGLTGLLVPWITTRWANRDKQVEAQHLAIQQELDVKSRLVNSIGTASAAFLSSVETGRIPGPNADDEYRVLKVASLQIGSQLAAYFPGKETPISLASQDWRDYTYSLRNTYLLLRAPSGAARNHWLNLINRYFNVPSSDYRHFAALCSPKSSDFETGLQSLVLAFQNQEERIVSDVAASETVLTGEPSPSATPQHPAYTPEQQKPCS